jgi:hypothetical protein
MTYSDELLAVAKRIFWFGTPEEALEFPKRFLTYAMTYASDEDIEILRKYFTDDDFKATLDDPAPGIFDRSSWAKWNERNVTSALPSRRFRGERFPASIPQPSPISFPPSIENISEVYRLFLSFESSVPCTSVFTFRVPRQWKPGLFSGSNRRRFASGSRSSTASTFVPCGSSASRGLSCFPQLLVAVGFFAFLLRETVL